MFLGGVFSCLSQSFACNLAQIILIMPKKKTSGKRGNADENGLPESVGLSNDECKLSEEDKLQKELNWCIEQLRLGLMTQKSSAKQVQESVRLIKTLSSSSAPLVKKRQIMRQTFGDYRKKIADEETKWEKETEKLKKKLVISQSEHGKSESVFIRSATTNTNSNSELEIALEQCTLQTDNKSVIKKDETANEDDAERACNFKFNFDIPQT